MTPVPEYHGIDRARFEAEIVPAARPAILRGLVADWPAVEAGRESVDGFAAYLRGQANNAAGEAWFGDPAIAGRFDFDAELAGFNHDRKLATVDQLLDLLLRQRGSAEPWGIYAGALPLAKHLPGFAAANPMPLLDADRHMLTSLWLGNRTKTAAHWDLPQNLACVVLGRRKFTLFPPDQIANLYIGPLEMTPAGAPVSMVDPDAPDLARYPRFAQALEAAQTAELAPGDALYIPYFWWHAVRSLDPLSVLVNYWWSDVREDVPFVDALLHAILSTRDLPPARRAIWKSLFDALVFQSEGDPVAHLPEQVRGVFGTLTPAQRRELSAHLAQSLARNHQ